MSERPSAGSGQTASRMDAGGIEPPSRDDDCGGLYMLSPRFDLDASSSHGPLLPTPSPKISPRDLGRIAQPARYCGHRATGTRDDRDYLFLGSHCVFKTTVVGSYGFAR